MRTVFALVLIVMTSAYSLAQERTLITNVHVLMA